MAIEIEEHWSGPDDLIQRNAVERKTTVGTEQANQIAKILKDAFEAISSLSKRNNGKGREPEQHWAGPDNLLGH